MDAITFDDLPIPVSYEDSWTERDPAKPDPLSEGDTQDALQTGPDPLSDNYSQVAMPNAEDEEPGPSLPSTKSTPTESGDSSSIDEPLQGPPTKIPRRRWSRSENKSFMQAMKSYVESKTMPPGEVIAVLHRKLKTRSIPQIRTKIHNIISGKQKWS